jgi:uncharacterized protein YceK
MRLKRIQAKTKVEIMSTKTAMAIALLVAVTALLHAGCAPFYEQTGPGMGAGGRDTGNDVRWNRLGRGRLSLKR